jgi:hypothetical protein
MTHDRDIERVLDLWFADGPMEVSDRVFDEAVERIHRQPQRRSWRFLWREPNVSSPMRLAAAAVVAIVAVAVAAVLFYPRLTPTPAVGPTASPSPTCLKPYSDQVTQFEDCTYTTTNFAVPLSIRLDSRWRPSQSFSQNWLGLRVVLPDAPANVQALSLDFFVLDRVFDTQCHRADVIPGSSTKYKGATPQDFWSWLGRSAPMVTFATPLEVSVAGHRGLQAVSTTKVNQIVDACQNGGVDIGDLGAGEWFILFAENPDRLTAVVVDGKTLLINVRIDSGGPSDASDAAYFPTLTAAADQVLASLEFRSAAPSVNP